MVLIAASTALRRTHRVLVGVRGDGGVVVASGGGGGCGGGGGGDSVTLPDISEGTDRVAERIPEWIPFEVDDFQRAREPLQGFRMMVGDDVWGIGVSAQDLRFRV